MGSTQTEGGICMKFFTKRRITILAVLLIALIAAIGGWAYFTANGTGSGTAAVGTSTNLTLVGTASTTLYPGTTSPITFTVSNPSTGHEQLGTIYLAGVKACTGAGSAWNGSACSNGGTEQTTCESVDPGNAADANASNFYMADVVENQDVAGGATNIATTNSGTLKMNNLASAQDSCKNANLYLVLATR
jgi:hypothetical protein